MGYGIALLDRIILHEVEMPLKEPFRSSHGLETARRFLVVEAQKDGVSGYGEVPVLSTPTYIGETSATAWHILADFLIPAVFRVRGDNFADPINRLNQALSSIKGNNMAKSGLEGAVLDLLARERGESLATLIGSAGRRVDVGAAIGIQPNLDALIAKAAEYIELGYKRLKIKIQPGWDVEPLRALRRHFGNVAMMADANGAYTIDDMDHLRRLDELQLLMIEQPFGDDDWLEHARLQSAMETPICLDESISSLARTKLALTLQSCSVICIKPGRLGGLLAAKAIHDYCSGKGVPVWCGGMLESGIGRAHNLALASLPNFAYPADLSASSRYWHQDIIEPPFVVNADGTMDVPEGPGIGVEPSRHWLEYYTLRSEVFERISNM